jgi:hypothetical protein
MSLLASVSAKNSVTITSINMSDIENNPTFLVELSLSDPELCALGQIGHPAFQSLISKRTIARILVEDLKLSAKIKDQLAKTLSEILSEENLKEQVNKEVQEQLNQVTAFFSQYGQVVNCKGEIRSMYFRPANVSRFEEVFEEYRKKSPFFKFESLKMVPDVT